MDTGQDSVSEFQRLEAVRRYDILDTPPDGAFDRVTAIAADLFSVPIAIISLVDTDRIWFKSHHGLEVGQVERELGLCASAIIHEGAWLLTDAKLDVRSLSNSLVAGEFGLRFYLGIPLRTHDGFNLGTLCVIDRDPRIVSEKQIKHLEDLAAIVMDEMELRLAARVALAKLSAAVSEKDAAWRRAEFMSKEIGHRVMNSLQIVGNLLQIQALSPATVDARTELLTAAGRVAAVGRVHQHVSSGPSEEGTAAVQYLQRLCSDLTSILGVTIQAPFGDLPEIYVNTDVIVSLGLIVNETATNAAKHGATSIAVTLMDIGAGQLALSVSDNGHGLQDGFDPTAASGLGMKVVANAVNRLGGSLAYGPAVGNLGAAFKVKFPVRRTTS